MREARGETWPSRDSFPKYEESMTMMDYDDGKCLFLAPVLRYSPQRRSWKRLETGDRKMRKV
jgi:hypothetical protein